MAYLPLRTFALPDQTRQVYDAWLEELGAKLAAPDADWTAITRDTLFGLYHPFGGDYDERVNDPRTPPVARAALLALDPRNISLEAEYYADVDQAKFARVKPLLWLW